jgi:hypothetical protein
MTSQGGYVWEEVVRYWESMYNVSRWSDAGRRPVGPRAHPGGVGVNREDRVGSQVVCIFVGWERERDGG